MYGKLCIFTAFLVNSGTIYTKRFCSINDSCLAWVLVFSFFTLQKLPPKAKHEVPFCCRKNLDKREKLSPGSCKIPQQRSSLASIEKTTIINDCRRSSLCEYEWNVQLLRFSKVFKIIVHNSGVPAIGVIKGTVPLPSLRTICIDGPTISTSLLL